MTTSTLAKKLKMYSSNENKKLKREPLITASVADPHHFDPDPVCHFDTDPDPDSTFHFDADPYPSFQIKAQNLEKVLKLAHIPYVLACHLQIDADADLDPAYHFDVDPDRDPTFKFDANPDLQHWLRPSPMPVPYMG
jgi:hypothetical protein